MSQFKTALVAGASGSGKTLIAKMFQNAYVHSMDDYFRGPFKANQDGVPEWDHPSAISFDEWITDYHRIKQAIALKQTIDLPKYHYKTHTVTVESFDFSNTSFSLVKWIVLEGLFALDPRLHHLADIKVFVEAPFSLRVSRRLKRDLGPRTDDLKFVLLHSYYTETSYQQYILPQRALADLVIPNYAMEN